MWTQIICNLVAAFFLAGLTVALPVELITGIPYRELANTRSTIILFGLMPIYWFLLMRYVRW